MPVRRSERSRSLRVAAACSAEYLRVVLLQSMYLSIIKSFVVEELSMCLSIRARTFIV